MKLFRGSNAVFKMKVTVGDDEHRLSIFKIKADGVYVTIKSNAIRVVNGSVATPTLTELLSQMISHSCFVEALAKDAINSNDYKGMKVFNAYEDDDDCYVHISTNPLYAFSPNFNRFDLVLLPAKESNYPELDINTFEVPVSSIVCIEFKAFVFMLAYVYNKLENDKAPIDTDDDIEDHDNYFKAYSNTKFTKESLKRLLKMSGNDHSDEED